MTFAKDDYVSDGRMTIIDKNASGSVIRVDDAYPTPHTINKTTVFGKSDQVVIRGINLLGGDTYVSGYNIRGFKNKLKPNNAYTYSVSEIVDANAAFRLIAYNSKQKNEIGLNSGYIANQSNAFITPQNISEYDELYLGGNYIDAGKNCINKNFMVEDGTVAHKYEPYTDGKQYPNTEEASPITNVTDVKINITGKNLINPNRLAEIDRDYFDVVNGNLKIIRSHNAAWSDVPIYGTLQAGTYSISGDNIEIYSSDLEKICQLYNGKKATFTIYKPTQIKIKVGVGLSSYPIISKAQLEAGSAATEYEQYQFKSVTIDLKGNELCSLPNGVNDELVIDADGNVNIIKNIAHIQIDGNMVQNVGAHDNGQKYASIPLNNCVRDEKPNIICSNYISSVWTNEDNRIYMPSKLGAIITDNRFVDKETAKKLIDEMKPMVIYQVAEPQTINLGTIENVPRLNSTTSTIWADTNVPTDMQINYKSYLQEDTMAEKKYLDLAGLTGYDAKIKAAVDAKDAATLQGAKAYADSLGANYDAAGSAATAKQQAIDAANGHTNGEIAKVNTKVGEVEKKAQQGITDAAAAKAAADKAQGEVDALETLVGTLPEDAGVATVVAYVDKKTEGMASDTLLKQLQATVGQHTTDISGLKEKDTALQGAVDKAQGAATANKATIDQLVGADKNKSIRAIANEELAAQLIPETADETLNTLKEIADWIQKHPNDAAAMNSAIEKLKTLIGTIPSEGVTAKDITGYIAEVKAALEKSVAAEKSRAEAAESGLGGRINTLEGKFGDGEGSVSSLIEAAKQAAISAAAADAQKKADTAKTAAVADAKKYTDTEVGKVKTASDAIGARVTAAEGKITTLESKAHTHANADALNGITAGKVANWDAAFAAKHTHANAAALDKVTDGKINAWDTAETNAKAYTDQKIGEFVAISVSEIDALFADA